MSSLRHDSTILLVAFVSSAIHSLSVQADMMVFPVSASTAAPLLQPWVPVSNLVAQNVAPFASGGDYGLSTNYNSSTDFGVFTDSVTGAVHSQHSAAVSGPSWAVSWDFALPTPVDVDFDLGGMHMVTSLACLGISLLGSLLWRLHVVGPTGKFTLDRECGSHRKHL